MNDAGLHPAFLPAYALEEPVPEFRGASSDVSEFRLPTLWPRRANRIPRSASSATFHSSQPPTRLRAAVRKWFDVPPSAIGISSAQRPGLIRSNNAAYSTAK